MVNVIDPTKRRQLRVLKINASRGKIQINTTLTLSSSSSSSSSSPTPSTSLSISSSSSSSSSNNNNNYSNSDDCLSDSFLKKQARQIRNRQSAIISRQKYLADAEQLKIKVGKKLFSFILSFLSHSLSLYFILIIYLFFNLF